MNIPNVCPFCHGVFKNNFKDGPSTSSSSQMCKQINHRFGFIQYTNWKNNTNYMIIGIGLDQYRDAYFFPSFITIMNSNNLELISQNGKRNAFIYNDLPFFFTPDFSDPRKVINKINTYLNFI